MTKQDRTIHVIIYLYNNLATTVQRSDRAKNVCVCVCPSLCMQKVRANF